MKLRPVTEGLLTGTDKSIHHKSSSLSSASSLSQPFKSRLLRSGRKTTVESSKKKPGLAEAIDRCAERRGCGETHDVQIGASNAGRACRRGRRVRFVWRECGAAEDDLWDAMVVLLRVSMGACNPLGVGKVFVMLVHNFWLTSWRPHLSGSNCQTRLLGLRLHVLLAMLSAITESRHRLLFSLAPLQSGVSNQWNQHVSDQPERRPACKRAQGRTCSWQDKKIYTCALRLTRVRAQRQASISVSRVWFHHPRHCSALFLAQACKHRLASASRLLTVLAGAISSLSAEVVGDCPTGLLIGFALQPARIASYLVAVTRHVSPVSVTAGRVTAESQAPLKVSGQKLFVKAPTSSSTQLRASPSKRARELLLVVLIVWFLAGLS